MAKPALKSSLSCLLRDLSTAFLATPSWPDDSCDSLYDSLVTAYLSGGADQAQGPVTGGERPQTVVIAKTESSVESPYEAPDVLLLQRYLVPGDPFCHQR